MIMIVVVDCSYVCLGSLLFVSADNLISSFTGRCHDVTSTLRIYQPIIISIYHQVKSYKQYVT